SPLAQAGGGSFGRSGGYDRHLRRMTRELAARHARAAAACERHLPRGAVVTRPEGGLAVWVTLPEPLDAMALLPEAKRRGVVYSPGVLFFPDRRRSASLRLVVAAAAEQRERAVRALGEAARAALSRLRKPRPAGVERAGIHV